MLRCAHLLSCRQYAGTGALKSGFTRTGKRTLAGLIDDGVKSMTRYYLNNFKVSRLPCMYRTGYCKAFTLAAEGLLASSSVHGLQRKHLPVLEAVAVLSCWHLCVTGQCLHCAVAARKLQSC